MLMHQYADADAISFFVTYCYFNASALQQPCVEEWDRLKYAGGEKQFLRDSIHPIWQDGQP